jgi:hypothetical protein
MVPHRDQVPFKHHVLHAQCCGNDEMDISRYAGIHPLCVGYTDRTVISSDAALLPAASTVIIL